MRFPLFALLLAVTTATARGESLPTFSLTRSNKHATHVVVVNKDGRVLESWRGNLPKDTQLPVDKMRYQKDWAVGDSGLDEKAKRPAKASGERVVLFLCDGYSWTGRPVGPGGWSASGFDFDTSAVWVEDGTALAVDQLSNPGDQVLVSIGTEKELKAAVQAMNKAAANKLKQADDKPAAERAKVLGKVIADPPAFAVEAFARLEKCGEAAVPVAAAMCDGVKPAVGPGEQIAAARTLVRLGKPAQKQVLKQLDRHLTFWKEQGELIRNVNRLEPEYGHEWMAKQLAELVAQPAAFTDVTAEQATAVAELRKVWADHPVLARVGDRGDRIPDRIDRCLVGVK